MPADIYYRTSRRRCVRLLAIWVPILCAAWCLWWLPQPWNVLAALAAWAGLFGWLGPRTRQAFSWRSAAPGRRAMTGHGSAHNRILAHGQTHPEGRDYWNVLLPDGAVLNGIAGPVHAVGGGRWHIALEQTPAPQPLLAYDSQAQSLHTIVQPQAGLDAAAFLEQVLADPATAAQRVRDACVRASHTTHLHRVHGLLLDPACTAPEPVLAHRLPDGALVEAHLLLPADLRAAADPTELLSLAPYRLIVDGRKTGLHVASLADVHASAGGACWIVRAVLLDGLRVRERVWHIRYRDRWHALADAAWSAGHAMALLQPVSVGDDGVLRFSLHAIEDMPAGLLPQRPLPAEVALDVSWRRTPLVLAPEHGEMVVRLPA